MISHKKQNERWKNAIWIFVGIVLVTLGINIIVFSPLAFESIIKSQRILHPGARFYKDWSKSPFPLSFNVYFFNWSNPEDIENPNIKPKFVEIGPYSFKEIKEKVGVVWNENNTVSYRLRKSWYFDEEATKGTLQDKITTLDPIARSVAYYAKDWGYLGKRGISLYLTNLASKIEITKTVEELLFEGYESLLLKISNKLSVGLEGPVLERFGYYYGRNRSTEAEGIFNMGTGAGTTELGKILRWRHKNETGNYPGECGKVHGYVQGDFFPSNCPKTPLNVFSAEQGRTYKLNFRNEDYVEKIHGYKFVAGEDILDNGTKFPENRCYCRGNCLPSGSMSTLNELSGIPLFTTYPHFYKADSFYLNMVDGMKPESSKHEIFVIIEPKTGIPLNGATRMQVNLLLEPDKYITMYNNVPKILVPVFWFEEKATIPSHLALLLRFFLNVPTYAFIFGLLCIFMGIFIIILNTLRAVPKESKRRELLKHKLKPKLKEEMVVNVECHL